MMKGTQFILIAFLFGSCTENVQITDVQDEPNKLGIISPKKQSVSLPELPLDSILIILSSRIQNVEKDTIDFTLYRKMGQDSIFVFGKYVPDPIVQYVPVFLKQNGLGKLRFRMLIDSIACGAEDEINFKENGFVYSDVLNKKEYAFPKVMKKDSFITGSNLFGHKVIEYKELRNKGEHLYFLKFDNTMITSASSFFSEVIVSPKSGIVYLKLSSPYNHYAYFSGV
jgi:hypothetical protein